MEILKTQLDVVLGNLFQMTLLEQGDGNWWSQEVPSNLCDSVSGIVEVNNTSQLLVKTCEVWTGLMKEESYYL